MFNNQDAKNILYSDSIKEKEERNKLLNELGDNLSPKQILYSSIDELKQIKGGIDAFRQNYHDIKEANTKRKKTAQK
ncbi:MAG: hypothetical protein IJ003_00595 [Candidatus Gastranaerophilales bacterium]|nr:hypothetical protein [Candidatus Gastranaerophilales bacterium]